MQCGLRIGEVFALKNVQEKYLENEQVVHGIFLCKESGTDI